MHVKKTVPDFAIVDLFEYTFAYGDCDGCGMPLMCGEDCHDYDPTCYQVSPVIHWRSIIGNTRYLSLWRELGCEMNTARHRVLSE